MSPGIVSSLLFGPNLPLPPPSPRSQPTNPLVGVYRTKDGRYLTVGALEPRFWQTLCRALDRPDLIAEQFAPPPRQAEIVAALQAVFETRSRAEWLVAFAGQDACVGPVNDVREALTDPQVRHRGMVAEVDGVPVGPGPAPKMSGHDPGPARPAPELGASTAEVLATIGLTETDVADLRARGVV
jgi:crotonobetainyl-CoA:carnitine CoA-transferase CaiB-like acyl-CoA transferase